MAQSLSAACRLQGTVTQNRHLCSSEAVTVCPDPKFEQSITAASRMYVSGVVCCCWRSSSISGPELVLEVSTTNVRRPADVWPKRILEKNLSGLSALYLPSSSSCPFQDLPSSAPLETHLNAVTNNSASDYNDVGIIGHGRLMALLW
jgi:hypothetical protein